MLELLIILCLTATRCFLVLDDRARGEFKIQWDRGHWPMGIVHGATLSAIVIALQDQEIVSKVGLLSVPILAFLVLVLFSIFPYPRRTAFIPLVISSGLLTLVWKTFVFCLYWLFFVFVYTLAVTFWPLTLIGFLIFKSDEDGVISPLYYYYLGRLAARHHHNIYG